MSAADWVTVIFIGAGALLAVTVVWVALEVWREETERDETERSLAWWVPETGRGTRSGRRNELDERLERLRMRRALRIRRRTIAETDKNRARSAVETEAGYLSLRDKLERHRAKRSR